MCALCMDSHMKFRDTALHNLVNLRNATVQNKVRCINCRNEQPKIMRSKNERLMLRPNFGLSNSKQITICLICRPDSFLCQLSSHFALTTCKNWDFSAWDVPNSHVSHVAQLCTPDTATRWQLGHRKITYQFLVRRWTMQNPCSLTCPKVQTA